jgi:hypothetical protein
VKKLISLFIITALVILITGPALTMAEDIVTPDPVLEPIETPEPTTCTAGQTQSCSTGLSGICSTGTQTCNDSGTWDSCVQTNQPTTVDCTNGLDNDCNGLIDNTEPACQTTSTPPADTTPPTPEITPGGIDTKFTETEIPEGTGKATTASPLIKAMWEMQGPVASLSGTDDSTDARAQFLPSGQYQINKPISVCAVVSDADGAVDISSVSSEVYYPMLSFGPEVKDGRTGCGQKKGAECQMVQLTKEEGFNLFCNTIQNSNANLPLFYDIYNFAGICGEEGELQKETAAVFCCDRELLYDDLSGGYKVLAFGQDIGGNSSNIFSGTFSYLELTAFETDFESLNYGNVGLNSRKTVEGDLIWQEPKAENQPTVRNVGNTRLQMEISQNDMGLGKTEGIWNIRYGSKVGVASPWKNYWPEEKTLLDLILDLDKMDQIDFAIEVLKFPLDDTKDYSGKMTLNAQKVEPLTCEVIPIP